MLQGDLGLEIAVILYVGHGEIFYEAPRSREPTSGRWWPPEVATFLALMRLKIQSTATALALMAQTAGHATSETTLELAMGIARGSNRPAIKSLSIELNKTNGRLSPMSHIWGWCLPLLLVGDNTGRWTAGEFTWTGREWTRDVRICALGRPASARWAERQG